MEEQRENTELLKQAARIIQSCSGGAWGEENREWIRGYCKEFGLEYEVSEDGTGAYHVKGV